MTDIVPRLTVGDATVARLRERILRGDFADGEPLRQDALAIALGVSRIPVREALRQLEAEGLVTFYPHRGAVVSTLSLDEIDEVFALRASLECDLMRRAIPRLTAAQLAAADAILDDFDRAFRAHDVAAWGELNHRFHTALQAPAARPITAGILQRLHQQGDRYSRVQLVLTHGESRAAAEHRAILAAVRERDVRHATALMKQHILGAGSALRDGLAAQRDQAAASRTPARVTLVAS